MNQQTPSPEVQYMQRRGATAQLASQLFMSLATDPGNFDTKADDLVTRAFDLAMAFDAQLLAFMEKPKIIPGQASDLLL